MVLNKIPKILFFDSGMGGLSVLSEVRRANPEAAYYYLFDHEGFPYGQKSEDFLVERVTALLTQVSTHLNPDLIVIACNTASTVVLDKIRPRFTRIPIVGVVPAIKTAGQLSHKRKIALLATPGTVQRAYTQRLIDNFAADCEVLRIGTVELVQLAEQCLLEEVNAKVCASGLTTSVGAASGLETFAPETFGPETSESIDSNLELYRSLVSDEPVPLPHLKLTDSQRHELQAILAPITRLPPPEQPDVVVLGCTHFPLLRDDIAALLGPAITLVDSGSAIGRRVKHVLAQLQESLELEPRSMDISHPLLTASQAGAWVAWFTGAVPADKRAQFEATFAYFGFHQIKPLPQP